MTAGGKAALWMSPDELLLLVPYAEAPLPGFPLHQLFLTDPFGLRVELTFDMTDAANGTA